jgi:hypothetical protein
MRIRIQVGKMTHSKRKSVVFKSWVLYVESQRLLLKLGHPLWKHKFVINECELSFLTVKINNFLVIKSLDPDRIRIYPRMLDQVSALKPMKTPHQ